MDKDNNEMRPNAGPSKDTISETSFVNKVKSRVSELIPSSISKWFNSNDDRPHNVRIRDELENDEESFIIQPPSKRIKRPSSDNLMNTMYEPHSTESKSEISKDSLTFEKCIKNSPSTASKNIYTIDYLVDKESENGSTSGYSSMARVLPKQHISDKTYPSDNFRRVTNTNDGIMEKSLFLDLNLSSSGNTSLSTRRPSFNASFGSPNFVDKTLSTKRIINSPFYKGRTIYGGAATYTGKYSHSSLENKNLMKTTVQIKPVNQPLVQDNVTLSKTARRILDTLDQYATPIADAKKIPTPTTKQLKSAFPTSSPYAIKEKFILNKELQIPTVPDLLKMKLKERLQDNTVSVRQIANSAKTEYNINVCGSSSKDGKHSNKMKSKITLTRQRKHDAKSDDTLAPINLPEVQLCITSLPKFDLTLPLNITSSTYNLAQHKDNTVNSSKPVNGLQTLKATSNLHKIDIEKSVSVPLEYEFSSPVIISENLKSIKAINNFIFSEPLAKLCTKVDNIHNNEINESNKRVNGERSEMLHNKSIGVYSNNGFNKANDKKTNEFGAEFKLSADKWECSICLVRNNQSDSMCIACTTPRPNLKAQNATSNKSDTWRCNTCLIVNDKKSLKCIACEAPAPISSDGKNNVSKPPVSQFKANEQFSGFGDKFKMGSDKWECPECMVRNSVDTNVCCACTTPRKVVQPAVTSNFGDQFKPSNDTWECAVCMIRNVNTLSKCAACESQKPDSKSTVKFGDQFKKKESEWECSSCMVRNPNNKTNCVCCNSSKPGNFTSSTVPAKIEVAKTSDFSFGVGGVFNAHGILYDSKQITNETIAKEVRTDFSFGTKVSTPSQLNDAHSGNKVITQEKDPQIKEKEDVIFLGECTKPKIESVPFSIPGPLFQSKETPSEHTNANKPVLSLTDTSKQPPINKLIALGNGNCSLQNNNATPNVTNLFNVPVQEPKTQNLFSFGVTANHKDFDNSNNKNDSKIQLPSINTPFGGTTTTMATSEKSNVFTNSKPDFSIKTDDQPLTNKQNEMFNFGNPSLNTLKTGFNFGSNKPNPSSTFNFGSNKPSPSSTFNFGSQVTVSSTSSGFNFGVTTTAANSTFKFSESGSAFAFTAAPGPEKPARIIKKAMRRTHR